MSEGRPCPYCSFVAKSDDRHTSDGDILVEHIDDAHDGTNRLVEGRLHELVYPEEAVRT